MKKELYVCSSYYQVLVSLMQTMTDGKSIDLVLEIHGIETAAALSEQIRSTLPDYVDKVFVCPNAETVDPYLQRETAAEEQLSAELKKHVEQILTADRLREDYEKINVFWDLGYVGTYLNIEKIPYILHEDSLNSYQHIRENRPHYAYIFDEQERQSHKGVIPFGYSPYCDRVEVNEISGIQIPGDKVTERSRKEMENALTTEQKQKIFHAFIPGDFRAGQASALLLTEPFALTGRLSDDSAQAVLYRDLVETYGDNGRILIKAHPRDPMDYGKLFPKATVLEKNIPMEVLNFNPDFSVDRAVTVTSSAVRGMEHAREKIYLGPEFLANYQ